MSIFDRIQGNKNFIPETFQYEKCSTSGTGYTYPYESDEKSCYGYDNHGRLHYMFKVSFNGNIVTFLIHQRYRNNSNELAISCPPEFIYNCRIRKSDEDIVLSLLNGEDVFVGYDSFKMV